MAPYRTLSERTSAVHELPQKGKKAVGAIVKLPTIAKVFWCPPLVAEFLLVSILFPNYGAIHFVRSCWFHSIKKNSARNSYQKLNGCWSIMIHIALILNAELRKVKIRRRKEIFPFTFRTIPSSIRAAFTDAFRTVSAWVGNAANGALPSPNGTPTRWR